VKRDRKSPRLKGYDYSTPGYYFITTMVKNRKSVFGEIQNNKMVLNEWGEIVKFCWNDLPNHYPCIRMDEFIVMPNHIHGIIEILPIAGAGLKPAPAEKTTKPAPARKSYKPAPARKSYKPAPALTEIVRALKTFSSRRINETKLEQPFCWQRSFHDCIIRNNDELNRIRYYIQQNPDRWEEKNVA